MDYLQYFDRNKREDLDRVSFKPYYKWITFNIEASIHAETDDI